ncbi:unnamed protein product, partial [Discosporangium mesarthrocarpum]
RVKDEQWWGRLEMAIVPLAVLLFMARQVLSPNSRSFWAGKTAALLRNPLLEVWLMLRFPYAWEAGMVVCALMAASKVRVKSERGDLGPGAPPGAVGGFVRVCLRAFGGQSLCCALLGRAGESMPLANDLAVPAAAVAWALAGGRWWACSRVVLSWPLVHDGLVVLAEAFRARLLVDGVDTAHLALGTTLGAGMTGAAGEASSRGEGVHPMWLLRVATAMGPAVAGIVSGCGGVFLPLDQGTTISSPLRAGVPWVVQSSVYGGIFYALAGGILPSAGPLVSLFFIVSFLVQSRRGPSFNPMGPLYDAIYHLLGAGKPLAVGPGARPTDTRSDATALGSPQAREGAGVRATAETGAGAVAGAPPLSPPVNREESALLALAQWGAEGAAWDRE